MVIHNMLPFSLALLVSLAQWPQAEVAATTANDKAGVRVYQTPRRPGSLTVQAVGRQPLSFYLFSTEGELVYQTNMQSRGQETIEGLPNGTYTFHAFRADEKLKGGKVELKN